MSKKKGQKRKQKGGADGEILSDVNSDDAAPKRKRTEGGGKQRKRKLKSRKERNNLAGRSQNMDDSDGGESSSKRNKNLPPTKQSGKIKSRAYISDSDSSISSAPEATAEESNPAPVSRLLSSDSDSDN